MKKSILSLVTMIVLGTGVMNGKTTITIVKNDKPRHEQVMHHHHDDPRNSKHDKHHDKHVKKHNKRHNTRTSYGLPIPKSQVTVSRQTMRF